jgi:hypothetical protein
VIVALEIVWVRLLGQTGMFHAYLFPTVLGVFLLADGLGIAVGSRLVRRVVAESRHFFTSLRRAADDRGVQPSELWRALELWGS